jgi:hypothetical protein
MAPNPTTAEADDSHMINYRDHHVAFIDILGFSDLVKASTKDSDTLFKIMNSLYLLDPQKVNKNIQKHLPASDSFGFVQFSDSLVLYDEMTATGFWRLVGIIIEITLDFASHGTLCRGGLTSGSLHVYRDEDGKQSRPIVFGPAFVEAYALESTVAVNPRVVLSRRAYELMDEYSAAAPWDTLRSEYIRRDRDGPAYIDVLRDIWEGLNSPSVEDQSDAVVIANAIREPLVKGLKEHMASPKVFAKYYWMAMRYNQLIKNRVASTNLIVPIRPFAGDEGKPPIESAVNYESEGYPKRWPRQSP